MSKKVYEILIDNVSTFQYFLHYVIFEEKKYSLYEKNVNIYIKIKSFYNLNNLWVSLN